VGDDAPVEWAGPGDDESPPTPAPTTRGITSWVRRYFNLARVMMRIVLPVPPGTYMYAK
jgi:hypothetical protein